MSAHILIIDSILVGICLLCANLLFLRRQDEGVYIPLALLFLFQGISYLPNVVFVALYGLDVQMSGQIYLNVLTTLLDLSSPVLFWLYVRGLTTEGDIKSVPGKYWHAVPIIFAALCVAPVIAIPTNVLNGSVPVTEELRPTIALVKQLLLIVELIFALMVAFYVVLTIRRLQSYRKRLRDIFSSTENRELTWIWLITISAGTYLVLTIADTVLQGFDLSPIGFSAPVFAVLDKVVVLLLMWVIGVWGLRQCPGLSSAPLEPTTTPSDPPAHKYKHSALDEDRAQRIAAKIETAMREELLYRDPNLSLWDLSKHISVTSHYVSQTLNTKLGRSFFDYVNHWRIKDAVAQLTTTNQTILMIAFDVGFNSRSSFYKAIKRETGKTPRDIRKSNH